jgi:hypothetical protein
MVNLLGRIVRVVAEILRDLDAVKHVPSALNNDPLQTPARRRSSEKRTLIWGRLKDFYSLRRQCPYTGDEELEDSTRTRHLFCSPPPSRCRGSNEGRGTCSCDGDNGGTELIASHLISGGCASVEILYSQRWCWEDATDDRVRCRRSFNLHPKAVCGARRSAHVGQESSGIVSDASEDGLG